ncbi:MAG: hypothetical protein KKD29_00250 [Candidatus Omnitrophica bacterium]|nr:hypothetical protein [Candidatus Omnitrophota bacterium]MBU4488007.1 hypothetical protein [Candidatus Omnitrophota bacterium]MCG2704751.1 hypothetical protein [Candidatus Omnitrophota bacterium]
MRKQAALTSAIFFIFLFLVPAEGQVYKYYSKGKRDPFIPLVTGEVRTSLGLQAVEDIDDVRLEGVIFDPNGKSIVVLNDEILKEGDKMYNVEVLKITKDSVTIKVHDRMHTISLVEEGGKES